MLCRVILVVGTNAFLGLILVFVLAIFDKGFSIINSIVPMKVENSSSSWFPEQLYDHCNESISSLVLGTQKIKPCLRIFKLPLRHYSRHASQATLRIPDKILVKWPLCPLAANLEPYFYTSLISLEPTFQIFGVTKTSLFLDSQYCNCPTEEIE